MKINHNFKSLNFDEREEGSAAEFLIIHYTACDLAESLRCLTDDSSPIPVSAHYLIDESGEVYQLVDEKVRAWHAGESYWRGIDGLNTWSVGIELVNPGYVLEYSPFPQPQMESLLALAQRIMRHHRIAPRNVLGHSDIAPGRKVDPGELFDWQWLASNGVGFFPDLRNTPRRGGKIDVLTVQKMLQKIGYYVPLTGVLDEYTQVVIKAFQLHFYPGRVDGTIDNELIKRLQLCQETE